MKRFYMLLLFVVVAMNCLYASVHTGSCGPNVTYSLDTETRVLTISGTGAMKDYSKSGAPWYSRNNSYIERVVIEDGVTTIGDYSFEWCYRLSSVSIPNSVTSIGEHAFENCTLYLSSVTIGNSVTSIGEYAFNGCSRLSSITIGNSVKSIGSAAFEDCSALTAVHYTGDEAGWCEIRFDDYEANPLYYAHNLYIDNTLVTDLVIPESVTEIKDYAFSGCSVTQVTIGNSVTSIGDYAFCKCSGLSSVTIGNSVESIGGYAFSDCSGLTSIIIPNSVTSIGEAAFELCTSLSSITIPNSVTSIGDNAFCKCSGLTFITIPNSVTSIGDYAFSGCLEMTELQIEDGPSQLTFGISVFVNSPLSTVYIGRNFTYTDSPFDGKSSIHQLTIGNSVTSIGDYAFDGCTNLTSVTIGNSVTSIGDHAFEDCTGLTFVTIPNSVKSIGDCAFLRCTSLFSITIPNSVTSIGGSAFNDCTSLSYVTIGNSVKSIGYRAFYDCTSLSSITIPNSVTSIGSYAFAGCSGLTELLIPGSVTSIENGFVYGCDSLAKLFMFPETDFRDCLDGWQGDLYVQELTMEQQDIFDNPTDSIYSLADYYIETRSEQLTNGTFKVSLTPRYENVTINYVQYKSSKDGNYQELLQGADGYYYFETTPEWPEYDLSIGVSIGDHSDQKMSKKLGEIVPNPTYTFLNRTQTTLQFQVESIKPSWCTEYGVCTYDWWWGNSIDSYYPVDEEGVVTITGLKPGVTYDIKAYAMYGDTILYSIGDPGSYLTLDVSPSISVISRTPTTITVKGYSGHGNATLIESGFTKTSDSKEFIGGDEMKWTNLYPDRTYTFYYATHTEEGGYDRTTLEVATLHPSLTTESAQPTSTTSVRLMATANLDDEEMRAGFQWRRYDAPDEMPLNEVSCPVVEGSLVGSLRNVNPEVYYKYRPFLKINDTYYYGDWAVFFTGDAAVYFEPEVRTYDALSVTANGATLDGYALEGSDAISSQGFEYWTTTPLTKASTNGGVQKVTVSGIRMQTTLTDLEPGTTYSFRAFATTASGTVYGEEKQFTTEPVVAVEEIKGSNGLEMDVKLRSNPVTRGTAWVQVSGTTAAAVQYRVVSITGQVMSAGTLTCGEWQSIDACFPAGMYLFMVNDGTKSRTVKFIVK